MIRAVLVDDSTDLRNLTRLNLELDGSAEVIGEAADAIEGLNVIEQLLPDVAVVDIHLPGMSGIELIHCLRLRKATLRLVAYSSDDMGLRDALEAGADAAVLKTGFIEDLCTAIAG